MLAVVLFDGMSGIVFRRVALAVGLFLLLNSYLLVDDHLLISTSFQLIPNCRLFCVFWVFTHGPVLAGTFVSLRCFLVTSGSVH